MSLHTVCFLLVLFFTQVLLQDKPYNFRPESRHIDINEGDDYFIGFDEIGNQTIFGHCSIKSATYSIDYPILEPPNNDTDEVQMRSDSSSEFSPYNGTGICAFVLYTVDDTVPLNWTITAHDNKTEIDFTEEVTVKFYYNMPAYMKQLVALETASIVNYFDSGATKLTKCTLGFDNVTVDLDLNEVKVNTEDNVFKSRLTSLGDGKCGYKINNVNLNDSRDLTLYATDEQNKEYRSTTQFVVIVSEFLKNRTAEVYLGDSTVVICGKETDTSANSDQKFCHLYDPQGVLVSHDHMCEYKLDIVTMDDLGTWKCLVGFDYIMDTLEFTTELVEKKSEYVTTFTNETTNYYTIGCQFVNFYYNSLEYCKFTRPDGKVFKVTTGGATPNYNTFSTDLENRICVLEILKPLKPEDQGSWKCEAGWANEMSGAFIPVVTSTTFPYDKYKKKNVQLGNSFVIDCMVPYASDYCYIIAPNKTQYQPDSILHVMAGVCMFTVDDAVSTDNGTWQCSIAQSNGIPDEIISVDISVIELKVLSADVEAAKNEDAELICNTNGILIKYCRFVSPSGLSYSLRKDNSTTEKISYHGRGLEYGDCGMKISNVELSDQGLWACHINPGRQSYLPNEDLTRFINLSIIAPQSYVSTG